MTLHSVALAELGLYTGMATSCDKVPFGGGGGAREIDSVCKKHIIIKPETLSPKTLKRKL